MTVRSGALVAVLLAALACAAPAALAAPAISVKAAKHKQGPYKGDKQNLNLGVGKTKTLYWKVKNTTDDPRDVTFLDGPAPVPGSYELGWFRAPDDITSQVDGSGYEFSLGAGDVGIFRARLERTSGGPGFCLLGQAGPPFDSAYFGVNGDSCV